MQNKIEHVKQTQKNELEFTFRTDLLFKKLFVDNPELLKNLVSNLLDIRMQNIQEFKIINPEMPIDFIRTKFARLDINMLVNSQRVELEIQVESKSHYPERILFNWAKNYTSALPSGKNYSELPRTVVISINKKPLFDCKEFHSEFVLLETTRHDPLSDRMSLHFYELEKIPLENIEENMLLLWLNLFNASTKEDLDKIKVMEVPEMNQAINAYYNITADSTFRETARMIEKAKHDEAQALYDAKQEGKREADAKWQSIVAEKDAEITRSLEKARHDEAQALYDAEQKGKKEADVKWQDIVANKDAEIARLRSALKAK